MVRAEVEWVIPGVPGCLCRWELLCGPRRFNEGAHANMFATPIPPMQLPNLNRPARRSNYILPPPPAKWSSRQVWSEPHVLRIIILNHLIFHSDAIIPRSYLTSQFDSEDREGYFLKRSISMNGVRALDLWPARSKTDVHG